MKTILSISKALSDRNRLRILASLSVYNELCGCQITELLQVSGATASRHLGVLQTAGLIRSRKEGRWIFFRKDEQLRDSGELREIDGWLTGRLAVARELEEDRRRLQEIAAMDKSELCRIQREEQ